MLFIYNLDPMAVLTLIILIFSTAVKQELVGHIFHVPIMHTELLHKSLYFELAINITRGL